MEALDWIIVAVYIAVLIGMSYFIGRAQNDQDDYYLGGRRIPPWQVGTSMVANQVSAISLIGAPAFIAVKSRGGLKWLQYELAIPLAMMVLIAFIVPALRSIRGITIYQYLEERFGVSVRLTLSLIFLLSRSLATGVALLATSYVTSVCIDLPLNETIIIIGIISLLYTALGGIKADIYSDIMQLVILWGSSFLLIGILYNLLGGNISFPEHASSRLEVFDMSSTGLGDGNTFSFWPMLFGGFFLYISYYGCDQSQAQRLLATKDAIGAQKSLLINGIMRFPLVLTYCVIGLLLIPLLEKFPDFADRVRTLPPDYIMPHFFDRYVPPGLLGIIIAGIFAASMSSLDSAINSLSAATWEDFLVKLAPRINSISNRKKILTSRIITLFWGVFAITASIRMAGGPDTVIELVNKIGSAFYGPIAGVFILGISSRRAGTHAALAGLFSGVALNMLLWLGFAESVSWMWWNLSGFAVTLFVGSVSGFFIGEGEVVSMEGLSIAELVKKIPARFMAALLGWFVLITAVSIIISGVIV
jgi:SSS family solute:Na+ symporter